MAVRLLGLLAFLNFDNIFPNCLGGQQVRKCWQQQQAKCPTDSGSHTSHLVINMLEAAFGALQTYSLVQWRDDRGGYAMHKLVHVWG